MTGCARSMAADCPSSRRRRRRCPPRRSPNGRVREDFDGQQLPIDFQWLRSPYPEELFSLSARPGYLRLYGRETIGSVFRQSLVARRQQAHCYSAITAMEFEPAHFQQAAGLVCYYNSSKFHYLHVSHDEEHGRHLRVMSCMPDSPQSDFFTAPIPIPAGSHRTARRSGLRAPAIRVPRRRRVWNWLPELFDASILSDECTGPGSANFTGAFVGMACQDMSGTGHPADFDFFEYREREYRVLRQIGRDVDRLYIPGRSSVTEPRAPIWFPISVDSKKQSDKVHLQVHYESDFCLCDYAAMVSGCEATVCNTPEPTGF